MNSMSLSGHHTKYPQNQNIFQLCCLIGIDIDVGVDHRVIIQNIDITSDLSYGYAKMEEFRRKWQNCETAQLQTLSHEYY